MRRTIAFALALAALGSLGALACASLDFRDLPTDGEARVLVVANGRDRASIRLAQRYAMARRVRPTHVLRLACSSDEQIDRPSYEREILRPLVTWWLACPDSLRPDYIVLSAAIPIGVRGSEGRDAERASVDSELTLLPREAAGTEIRRAGRFPNPYFQAADDVGFARFDHQKFGICLVTRLAGFTEEEAGGLIERAKTTASAAIAAGATGAARESSGLFLFDQRAGEEDSGQRWLRQAAERVSALRARALLDTTPTFVARADDLMGYASWGSNDHRYQRDFAFTWRPGAIATEYVSSSARTLREPPTDWRPGRDANREAHFGGSPQSLALDLVRSGATGVAGHVYEPYLDGCPRPDILFPAYLSGRTLGESYYLAIPSLSWMNLVIGDPLCAPYVVE